MTNFRTLCTRCLTPIDCEWPDEMKWAGRAMPTVEYVGNAMRSNNVMICCDDCLAKMPDVKLEDLRIYGRDN
jgi:hypothetical protein